MPILSLLLRNLRPTRVNFSPIVFAIAALLLPTEGRAQTFGPTVSTQISIPNGTGTSTPAQYPTSGSCTNNAACIAVTGLTGSYTSMSVNLTFNPLNNNQTFSSAAWLLESPNGQYIDMLSYGCADDTVQTTPATITVTLTDAASSLFPAANINCNSLGTTGNTTYKPAAYGDLTGGTQAFPADYFPTPGPGSSYTIAGDGSDPCASGNPTCTTGTGTFANTFCSSPSSCVAGLNGTWKLYAVDQGGLASPTQFTWTLTFNVTGSNVGTTTSLARGNPNPAFSSSPGNSVALTATVTYNGGNPVPGGTVTFYDNTTSTNLGTGTVSSSDGEATINAMFSAQGIHQLYAVYNGTTGYASSQSSGYVNQTVVNHAAESTSGSVTSFCDNGAISLSSDAAGNPYPAMIVLGNSGITTEPTLSGTIESVSVSLNGINLTNFEELDDLGFALQAPGTTSTYFSSNGNTFEFLSWAGNPFTSGSLTISDTGSAEIPYDQAPSCTNSVCLPTDNWVDIGSSNLDTFPTPGPTSFDKAAPTGSATFATDFGGGAVSGTWSLWVDNRISTGGPPGSIGSWCLNFTTQVGANPTTTTVGASANPASFSTGTTATVTLTANVTSSGGTVNAGTVTFDDGSTELGSATVSGGVATLTGVNLTEGTHQILGSYGGTNSGTAFGISSGKFDERVNKTTTVTGAQPYSYCNSGAIIAPGLGEDSGAAYPYPSNILVTNLPGTVKATTISINGFNTKDQGDLMSLLVGPSTNGNQWNNNFDFFSLTGSNVSSPSTSNLLFADGAASILNTNVETSGTYAPGSKDNLAFPQCGQNASDCGTENVGPPLGTGSTFTPTNKAASEGTSILGNANEAGVFGGTSASTYFGNGTWSLYLDDGGPLGGGEDTNLTQGWCVNFTENLVSATPTAAHSGEGKSGDFVQGEASGAAISVNVANNGTGSAGDPAGNNTNPLSVTDVLPTGLTYIASGSGGSGWTCPPTVTGQTVTCTNDAASVVQGNSYPTLTINVGVATNATSPLSNSVSVSGADFGAATSNADSIMVDPPPALAVSVSHASSFTNNDFKQGQNGTWNIQVSNTASGGATFGTITVNDTLPTGYTLAGSSATGGSFTCGASSNVVTCTSVSGVTINAGSSDTIQLTVGVPLNSPTSVSDSASAFGGGDPVHTSGTPAQSNTDTVTVIQVPAAIALSGNNQTATVEGAFSNALGVTVTDAASAAINNQSVTFTAPGSGASGTFSNSTGTITASTDSGGQVSEVFTANGAAGSYTVSVATGTISNHFNLTNTYPPASLASPTPGSVLTGSKDTFSWSSVTGATSYSFRLGTSVGANNLYASGTITGTSATASNLPTNGEKIYARLYTNFPSSQGYNDYVFTAAAEAVLTSPTPGAVLTSSNVKFIWGSVTGATSYSFRLGTSVGANNLYASGAITSTFATAANLPTNGEKIYARLYTNVGSTQTYNDYVFTAETAAVLTSPAPGTVLTGSKVTFTWGSIAGATSYSFRLGTSVGANNLYASGPITSTSASVSSLPANGEKIYARLYTNVGSTQTYIDYVFTAATAAGLTSPLGGATFTGASQVFTWSAGTGVGYSFRLGTTVGGNNLYGSGTITKTTATAASLPTNSETIYGRLYTTYTNGSQSYTDYVFTAAP